MAGDPVSELEEPAEKRAARLEKLLPSREEIEAAPFQYSYCRLKAFRDALAEFDAEVTFYADDIVIAVPWDDPMNFLPTARILMQRFKEAMFIERVDH